MFTIAPIVDFSTTVYFLRVLRRNHIEEELLVAFYSSTIESALTYCIAVWYASFSAADRTALERVVNTA